VIKVIIFRRKKEAEIWAYLFDLDGTLVDSREECWINFFQAARNLGLRTPTREEFLKVWGYPWEEILSKLLPEVNVPLFNATHDALKKERMSPVPGVKKALKKLKRKGNFTAVISSRDGESLKEIMEQAGIGFKFFDYVQSFYGSQFSKPDPRVFNRVLSLMAERGIPKSRAVYIGDTLLDLEAAELAGIEFFAVLTGGATEQNFLTAGLDKERILKSVRW